MASVQVGGGYIAQPVKSLFDDHIQLAGGGEQVKVGAWITGDECHIMEVVIRIDNDRQHGDVVCLGEFGFRQRTIPVDRRVTIADQHADIGHVRSVTGTAEHHRTHLYKSRLQRKPSTFTFSCNLIVVVVI